MHTTKTSHLQGLDRVLRYRTKATTNVTVWLTTAELIDMFKKRFYFLEVKLTDARSGQYLAARRCMVELEEYVQKAKLWVATQEQTMTNFERRQFDVYLISARGSALLKVFTTFDQVMTDLASAQFFGGQPENLRLNYLHGFTGHLHTLLEIAMKSPMHFEADGVMRKPITLTIAKAA